MPPAFVQSKGGTTNTANELDITFTSNNTVGNLLVCGGRTNGTAAPVVSDTQGNTWVAVLHDNWNGPNSFYTAYAANCKGGANTVKIVQPAANISAVIGEYSGVAITTPLDKSTVADSGAGNWTSASSGNVTTTQDGELIIGIQGNGTGPASVTLGSGFANLQNDSANVASLESQVQTTHGAIAATFTMSSSTGACGVMTFFAAGGGGGSSVGWVNRHRRFVNKRG